MWVRPDEHPIITEVLIDVCQGVVQFGKEHAFKVCEEIKQLLLFMSGHAAYTHKLWHAEEMEKKRKIQRRQEEREFRLSVKKDEEERRKRIDKSGHDS